MSKYEMTMEKNHAFAERVLAGHVPGVGQKPNSLNSAANSPQIERRGRANGADDNSDDK